MAPRPITEKELQQLHADFNRELVEINQQWALIEQNQALLFGAVIKTRQQIALAILATVTSYKVRRDMIANAARLALGTKRDFAAVEKILKRLSKAARRRNQIVHGIIIVQPQYPHRLGIMSVHADADPALMAYELYTLGQLKAFTSQFSLLAGDIFSLVLRLRHARRRTLRGTRL